MRCFLVCGPESAGNRLVASVLVRAGVKGAGAQSHPWNKDELPSAKEEAVLIRSFPHGGRWCSMRRMLNDLEQRGYEVVVLVTVRHPLALAGSQVAHEHTQDFRSALENSQQAYRRILRGLPQDVAFYLVPYEALVLDPERAVAALLDLLELPRVLRGPLVVEGEERAITNENLKHYGATV